MRRNGSRILPEPIATGRNVTVGSSNRRENQEDDTTDPSYVDFGELSTDGYSMPDSVELVEVEPQPEEVETAENNDGKSSLNYNQDNHPR